MDGTLAPQAYRAKTYTFPRVGENGTVETCVWIERPIPQRLAVELPDHGTANFQHPKSGQLVSIQVDRIDPEPRTPQTQEQIDAENRARSARRRRTNLRRLCLARGYNGLITFNTRQESNTFDEIVGCWTEFSRWMDEQDIAYSAAPELHPKALREGREHWHIHVAIRANRVQKGDRSMPWFPVLAARHAWVRILKRRLGTDGAVNISPKTMEMWRKNHDDPERLAWYLSKYFTKADLDESLAGRKRVWSSKHGGTPILNSWVPAAQSWQELEQELLQDDCIEVTASFHADGFFWLMGRIRSREEVCNRLGVS